MVEKITDSKSGKTEYFGNIMGFSYCMQFESDEEFKTWLKGRLRETYFSDLTESILKDLFTDLLGIKELEEKVTALESEKVK